MRSNQLAKERLKSLEVIEGFIEENPEVVSVLMEVISNDPLPEIRSKALLLLNKVLDENSFVKVLLKSLDDPSEKVQKTAIGLIARLSQQNQKALLDKLLSLSSSAASDLHEICLQTLSQIHKENWRELADLLMGSPRTQDQLLSAELLGFIDDPAAGKLIESTLGYQNPHIRAALLRGLTRFLKTSTPSKALLEKLKPLIEDPNLEVRLNLTQLLLLMKDPAAEALLLRLRDDPDPKIRQLATAR